MTRTNRVLNGHAKAGFHSGRLHAKNIFAGRVDVDTSASGDGTTTVTFAKPMRNANYLVLLCPQETVTNADLTYCVTTKTPASFVINVTSTNQADPITMGFLVLDSRASGPTAHKNSRFGCHSGYVHFRNLQWGMVRATLNAAVTITLPYPMKNKPIIFASIDDDTAATAGFVYVATGGAQDNKTFKLDNASVAGPSGTVDITWVAFDPGFNFGTTDLVGHKKGTGGQNTGSKFGIHSGDFRAKNFVGGFVAATTSGGDITEAVTYGNMLRQTPAVFVFVQSPVNDATAQAYAASVSIAGHTIGVDNSATTTAVVYFGWLAIDPEFLITKKPESELVA